MYDDTDDREFPYLSDDPDRERDGLSNVPFQDPYGVSALRDEVARGLEELLETVDAWIEEETDGDRLGEAKRARALLEDLYERIGEPAEATDR